MVKYCTTVIKDHETLNSFEQHKRVTINKDSSIQKEYKIDDGQSIALYRKESGILIVPDTDLIMNVNQSINNSLITSLSYDRRSEWDFLCKGNSYLYVTARLIDCEKTIKDLELDEICKNSKEFREIKQNLLELDGFLNDDKEEIIPSIKEAEFKINGVKIKYSGNGDIENFGDIPKCKRNSILKKFEESFI